MNKWCLKESESSSKDSDNDKDDTILQPPKLSEILSKINVCRRYISTKCSGEALNSLISLDN